MVGVSVGVSEGNGICNSTTATSQTRKRQAIIEECILRGRGAKLSEAHGDDARTYILGLVDHISVCFKKRAEQWC